MNYYNRLLNLFCYINDKNIMDKVFNEVFTEKEILDLTNRIALIIKLNNGETQRKIAKDLHISLCKITRGSKILKNDFSALRKILKNKNI